MNFAAMLLAIYVYPGAPVTTQVIPWGVSTSEDCIGLAEAMNAQPSPKTDEKGRTLLSLQYQCVFMDALDIEKANSALAG